MRTTPVEDTERLTVPVGQQLHQAIQTRVPHLPDVGGAAADGLDGGGDKVFVHAFDVGLRGETAKCQLSAGASAPTKAEVSRSRRYLKLPEDGGDVCLVGEVGEDLQLRKRHKGSTRRH